MNVSVGKATYIGYFFAFLAFLTAVIGAVNDDGLPLGISPTVAIQVGAGIAIVTALGRYAQGLWGQHPVSWGLASTITFALAGVSALLIVIADLGDDAALLGVSPSTMAKVTGFLTSALVIGRMLQSALLAVRAPDPGPAFPPVIADPNIPVAPDVIEDDVEDFPDPLPPVEDVPDAIDPPGDEPPPPGPGDPIQGG